MYLKTMETFCKVILLNLSRSITWLIWTKIQVSRARLDSGNNPIRFFIPSIRFCGFEELETFSNWGIRASVSTGSGSSLTYCKYTEIKWLKTILDFFLNWSHGKIKIHTVRQVKVKDHMLLGCRMEVPNRYLCDIWLMQMISNCS